MKNPKKPTNKFQNLKGKGLETKSNEMYAPEPIKMPSQKIVAPRAKKINAKTEKQVAKAMSGIDKSASKYKAKSERLSAKSKVAAAKGKTRRANVLESRSKLIKFTDKDVNRAKSATASSMRKEGKTYADAAQQRFETRASMKVARRTGKITPKVQAVRDKRKQTAAKVATAAAGLGKMYLMGK